ncbi:MAG TPA: N-6 DNA methylase, partial [Chloroflexia bacterium]
SKPERGNEYDPKKHIIRIFEQTAEGLRQLNEFAGRLKIESGEFWQQEDAQKIDRAQRVDAALLDDLSRTEKDLIALGLKNIEDADELVSSVAHGLLGRAIFVAYLQDRRILKPEFLEQQFGASTFADILQSHSDTYRLFEWIRATFNGNLFPLEYKYDHPDRPNIREQVVVGDAHLDIVRQLMVGTKMETKQMRLWPYKFDVIPIELISSIYEMFAHATDRKAAKKRSTHYTPFNLVDLVLSETFNRLPANARILDPACGSGAFLVESLRRLVGRRISEGALRTRQLVRDTLHNQVYGIDVSDEAIQIAAFSLYLTALELDPNPEPPEELKFRPLVGSNLFASNTFNENAQFNKLKPFSDRGFDAIVGNPPWKVVSGDKENKDPVEYCIRHGLPSFRERPDQAFLWRVLDFAKDTSHIGLIMHAKPFFSQAPSAKKVTQQLLTTITPRVLVNLASLRTEKLFPTSTAPAMILIAETRKALPGDRVALVTVEKSDTFRRHGIIEVGPENIRHLSVQRLASDPDMLKVASYGSARDMALIERLRTTFPSLKMVVRQNGKNGWHAGQGFKRGRLLVPGLYGKKLLPSSRMPLYEVDWPALGELPRGLGFHRNTDHRIFRAPLVITSRNLRAGRFYAAYSARDVVYDSLYYGISIPTEQTETAHYLNGVLNSSLVNYFLFLTGSTWGVERDEIQPIDLSRLPIPMPNADNSGLVAQVLEIEAKLRQMTDDTQRSLLASKLDSLVFDLYGLSDPERVLVTDMVNHRLQSQTKKQRTASSRKPHPGMLEIYARQLLEVIEPFFKTLNKRGMVADVIKVDEAPLQVVRFSVVPTPVERPIVEDVQVPELRPFLESIANHLPQQLAEGIYTRRFMRIYVDSDLYIVKPAQERYWNQSAGLNDADAVLGEYLRSSHATAR